MTMGDRIKRTKAGSGRHVKGAAGKATGDQDMQAEGQGDQAAANIKQAGDKAKDLVGDVVGH